MPHTIEQRMNALALANEIRTRNAEFKKELAGMPYANALERLATVLVDEDELAGTVGSISVSNALMALPYFKHRKTAQLLRKAGILAPTTKLRDLTDDQRNRLSWALRARGGMADFDMRDYIPGLA